VDHPPLHSFPTRRSSDLRAVVVKNALVGKCDESDAVVQPLAQVGRGLPQRCQRRLHGERYAVAHFFEVGFEKGDAPISPKIMALDRKSTRLNSSHVKISY